MRKYITRKDMEGESYDDLLDEERRVIESFGQCTTPCDLGLSYSNTQWYLGKIREEMERRLEAGFEGTESPSPENGPDSAESLDELVAELREAGIDVEASFKRMEATIAHCEAVRGRHLLDNAREQRLKHKEGGIS